MCLLCEENSSSVRFGPPPLEPLPPIRPSEIGGLDTPSLAPAGTWAQVGSGWTASRSSSKSLQPGCSVIPGMTAEVGGEVGGDLTGSDFLVKAC